MSELQWITTIAVLLAAVVGLALATHPSLRHPTRLAVAGLNGWHATLHAITDWLTGNGTVDDLRARLDIIDTTHPDTLGLAGDATHLIRTTPAGDLRAALAPLIHHTPTPAGVDDEDLQSRLDTAQRALSAATERVVAAETETATVRAALGETEAKLNDALAKASSAADPAPNVAQLIAERDQAYQAMSTAQTAVTDLRVQLAASEARASDLQATADLVGRIQEQSHTLNSELDDARKANAALTAERDDAIDRARSLAAQLASAAGTGDGALAAAWAERDTARSQVDILTDLLAEMGAERNTLAQDLADARAELDATPNIDPSQVDALNTTIADLRVELATQVALVDQLRTATTAPAPVDPRDAVIAGQAARLAQMEEAVNIGVATIAELRGQLNLRPADDTTALARIAELETALTAAATANGELDTLRAQNSALTADLAAARSAIEELTAEVARLTVPAPAPETPTAPVGSTVPGPDEPQSPAASGPAQPADQVAATIAEIADPEHPDPVDG